MERLLAGMFAVLLAVACGAEVETTETVEPSDGGGGGSTTTATATTATGGAGGDGGAVGQGGAGGAAAEPVCETDDDCGECERCGWPLATACIPLDDCDEG